MRRINYSLLLVLLFVMCGCSNHQMKQLKYADQLLKEQQNDSAYHLLNSIAIEGVDDAAFQAYYTLLKIQAEYRLRLPINTTDMLDRSIAYYEKNRDTDKLIRCYYYKGTISDDLGNDTVAVAFLNKAETLLKGTDDSNYYKLCVYEVMANVNEKVKQYPMAINYLLSAVRCAVKQKDTIALAYDYMNLGAIYYEMGKEDSSSYFRQKMEPLIKHIPEQHRSSFYTNLGSHFEKINTDSAKAYYKRAIALGSHYAYNHMAQLYSKEGQHELALQNWEKASASKDPRLKIDVLSRMSKEYEKLHKFDEMCKIQSSLITLKDSISQKQSREDVRGIQKRFQMEQHQREKEKRIYRIIVSLLLLLVCALIIIIYMERRHSIQKAQLNEDKALLSKYLQQLKQLEENAEKNKREIRLLNNKILELENKKGVMQAMGKTLYDTIINGATTGKWHTEEFNCFISYYKVLDYEFITSLENNYNNLPPRYMFLEILSHMQFSKDKITHTMSIDESTIRSYKSRIKSYRKIITTKV